MYAQECDVYSFSHRNHYSFIAYMCISMLALSILSKTEAVSYMYMCRWD